MYGKEVIITGKVVANDLTSISPLPKELVEKLHCRLLHPRVAKMTEKGIVLFCKEGCDESV